MRRDLRSTPSVEPSIKKIDMETTTTQSETSAGADNANSTASPEPSTHAADFAATDKDFGRMMQMLTGYFVTQIAGAWPPTLLRIIPQRDPRLLNRLPQLKASIQRRLSAY